MNLSSTAAADSDGGEAAEKAAAAKKKAKRKKTQNLGPCIRVIAVTPVPDGGGLKVECALDTILQKTVTFEFLTSDLSTDEVASAFVSLLLGIPFIKLINYEKMSLPRSRAAS